jgi:diadenosine tetraphosphate (Ap4A) HIT family hydrolase
MSTCSLCQALGGELIFQHEKLRVVRADEAGYPAFYRLVWQAHVAEMSDLSDADFALCMKAVRIVERSLREQLNPAPLKINVASLGNIVPHLHWHVIARYEWDRHWPRPVWALAERADDAATLEALRAQLPDVQAAMREALAR